MQLISPGKHILPGLSGSCNEHDDSMMIYSSCKKKSKDHWIWTKILLVEVWKSKSYHCIKERKNV